MSKEKELAKNTFIIGIGKLCTQFITFLLLPLYTSLLRPDEFGIVDLLNTYVMLLVPLFNWQFENGMFRFLIDCRDDEKRKRTVYSTVILANIFQIILYLCFYVLFQSFISTDYKMFLAIDVALNILLNTMLQFPRGNGDNFTYALGSFLSAATTLSLNVIFIVGMHLGAWGIFYGTMLSKMVTIIFLFFKTKSWKYISLQECSYACFKQIFKYSIPLVPNSVSWWVVGASDRTVISTFLGVAENGIYSVANKFSSLFLTLYNIFHLSWTESVAVHINDDDSEEYINEIINESLLFFSAIGSGIMVLLPFVLPFLGNEYRNAYYQIPILILAVYFQIIVGLYSVIYTALKKTKEIMKTSVYAAIINVTLDLVLVNYIKIYAASISTLVAFQCMAFYRYFHVKRYINVRIKVMSLLFILLLGVLSGISYYTNTMEMRISTAIAVIVISFIKNKKVIKDVLLMLARVIKLIK